ncbi:hypothetical protein [Pseudomonas sp. B11(2017)]|uniref:hypothetical protein n=1 Tax=Pseudomonas sp. B11(2017) TaxID=1981748 RepID=UPI00111C3F56|nr:hypothetical protein [Pseudomonas sp. B11(2017)]
MKKFFDVKRSVLLLWGFAVSLFLWYFVMASENEFSVFQYFVFATLLFGGGLAYHVMSELAVCPYTEENSHLWREIRRTLCIVFLGYLFAGGALWVGIKWGGAVGVPFTIAGLVTGMLWALTFLMRLKAPVLELVAPR